MYVGVCLVALIVDLVSVSRGVAPKLHRSEAKVLLRNVRWPLPTISSVLNEFHHHYKVRLVLLYANMCSFSMNISPHHWSPLSSLFSASSSSLLVVFSSFHGQSLVISVLRSTLLPSSYLHRTLPHTTLAPPSHPPPTAQHRRRTIRPSTCAVSSPRCMLSCSPLPLLLCCTPPLLS